MPIVVPVLKKKSRFRKLYRDFFVFVLHNNLLENYSEIPRNQFIEPTYNKFCHIAKCLYFCEVKSGK